MSTMQSAMNVIRASDAARRAQRRKDSALARELAGYSSAADRLELDAVLDRHADEDTADVRRILAGIHA